MSHEMGHYFSLYHTHGKTNSGTTDELVNGSNCSSAGDDVCDTPADPNLSGLVNSSCQYTGSGKDANGDTYVPNPRNMMSYARKSCRTVLTAGQYNRIAYSLANDRNYLVCSSTNNSYCASKAGSPIDTEIDNVTFNTINQSSKNNCAAYTDYTSVSTNVVVGQSYSLSISTGDCDGGSNYDRGIAVYIDWNGNNDFTDSGEQVLLQANGSTYTASATVNVPSTATTGTTRMRVMAVEGGVTSPCGNYAYGETEDYSINIVSSVCASGATSTIDTEIDNVTFNTINQSSSSNCAGYTDYKSVSTNVTIGQSYTLSVSTGDCDGGNSYSRGIAAYIDWNRDADFTDAGEQVLLQANGQTLTASATVAIPSNASIGSTYMRVIATEGGVTSPCGDYTYGETEDYTINVTASSDIFNEEIQKEEIASKLDNRIKIYPNPTVGKLNIEVQLEGIHHLSYKTI